MQGSAPQEVKRKLVQLLKGSYVKLAKLGAPRRLVEALFLRLGQFGGVHAAALPFLLDCIVDSFDGDRGDGKVRMARTASKVADSIASGTEAEEFFEEEEPLSFRRKRLQHQCCAARHAASAASASVKAQCYVMCRSSAVHTERRGR